MKDFDVSTGAYREQDGALHLALGAADAKLQDKTRRLNIEAAEELLIQGDTIAAYVENALLSAPLPEVADIEGALKLCEELKASVLSGILKRVKEAQPQAILLHQAFQLVVRPVSGSEVPQHARLYAIRAGMFTKLVSLLSCGDKLQNKRAGDFMENPPEPDSEIGPYVDVVIDLWVLTLQKWVGQNWTEITFRCPETLVLMLKREQQASGDFLPMVIMKQQRIE